MKLFTVRRVQVRSIAQVVENHTTVLLLYRQIQHGANVCFVTSCLKHHAVNKISGNFEWLPEQTSWDFLASPYPWSAPNI